MNATVINSEVWQCYTPRDYGPIWLAPPNENNPKYARLDEAQAGTKTAGRNMNNLRYAESEEELKSFVMKVKEESGKVGLKLNIQKTKIMSSGPITSSQIDGETMETETLFSWAPKSLQMVTAAMKLKDAYSLEEKRWPI